jgi:hypothetical protein
MQGVTETDPLLGNSVYGVSARALTPYPGD